eukprot:scaffold4510_cov183-Amphora_coffeaeformis.AAC.66
MQALKRVVELNEAAVIGLHEGSIGSSVVLLREALNLYRVELTGDSKDVAYGPNVEPHDNVIGVQVHQGFCESDAKVSPDNIYHPFNCAFCFVEEVANVDSAAVVVLYNYGLSLHRRGMLKGNQTDLRRAIQLYAMAYGLLQDEAMSTRYELGRVGLALLANQTQLYHHFLDLEKVHSCLGHLRTMLENREQMNISSDEFSFFFHVLFFSSRRVPASPAA